MTFHVFDWSFTREQGLLPFLTAQGVLGTSATDCFSPRLWGWRCQKTCISIRNVGVGSCAVIRRNAQSLLHNCRDTNPVPLPVWSTGSHFSLPPWKEPKDRCSPRHLDSFPMTFLRMGFICFNFWFAQRGAAQFIIYSLGQKVHLGKYIFLHADQHPGKNQMIPAKKPPQMLLTPCLRPSQNCVFWIS